MKNKLMKTELEEAAFNFTAGKSVKEICSRMDFIKGSNFGSEWQQEQDKNLYSEEDLLNFGAFVRIEDKKEKRLFLIQDYFKKWLNTIKRNEL